MNRKQVKQIKDAFQLAYDYLSEPNFARGFDRLDYTISDQTNLLSSWFECAKVCYMTLEDYKAVLFFSLLYSRFFSDDLKDSERFICSSGESNCLQAPALIVVL